MPAVFAFADKVIGNPQTAIFAAFGSFAMLVLVDFTGPMRSRFVAYLALASVGAGNIVLGTFCSRNCTSEDPRCRSFDRCAASLSDWR